MKQFSWRWPIILFSVLRWLFLNWNYRYHKVWHPLFYKESFFLNLIIVENGIPTTKNNFCARKMEFQQQKLFFKQVFHKQKIMLVNWQKFTFSCTCITFLGNNYVFYYIKSKLYATPGKKIPIWADAVFCILQIVTPILQIFFHLHI